MEDFLKEKPTKKKKNIKLILGIILILIIIITIITLIVVYCENEKFRKWVDSEVLPKQVEEGKTVEIELDGQNMQIFAVDKYIITLQEKVLNFYNNLGTKVGTIPVEINTAIADVAGKYIVIAEKNGRKAYVISEKKVIWETETEGNIIQIEINENGYTGIVTSDVSYKNIISLYDSLGKQLLKTYLATTKVVDISISRNNQKLAIAEVDTTGILIQSSIKIISIEKAQSDPNNLIEYTHNADLNKLILNIEYKNKNRLVCMYKDTIEIIENGENREITNLQNVNNTFATIETNDNIINIEENIINDYEYNSIVHINNVSNKKEKTYSVEKITKNIKTFGDVIALNFGTELHVINKNGWLLKKYISSQEINNVVLTNKILGVIYRDKIEVIDI